MPAGLTTLGAIRQAAQQRADMVNSPFLSTAEWTANINASYQELYGLLCQKYGNDYFIAGTPDNFFQFTTGTTSSYPLPDGSSSYTLSDGATVAPALFKLIGVDLQLGTAPQGWATLRPFTMADRNRFATPNAQTFYGYANMRYRLSGNTLWLMPLPSAGQIVRLWYVPRLSVLENDGDLVDGVNGWEEYMVLDAAIKALQKEESDVSVLMAQKGAIIARLEAEAENRDAGAPPTVGDTRRSGMVGEPGSGSGWVP